jgi:hypothetical protein
MPNTMLHKTAQGITLTLDEADSRIWDDLDGGRVLRAALRAECQSHGLPWRILDHEGSPRDADACTLSAWLGVDICKPWDRTPLAGFRRP